MSETVNYIGKIKEFIVPSNITDLKDVVKYISNKFNIPESEFDISESYLGKECIYYSGNKLFNDTNTNKWYEIIEKKQIDIESGYLLANKNDDKTISFDLKYYNGGASFSEALCSALKNNNILGK